MGGGRSKGAKEIALPVMDEEQRTRRRRDTPPYRRRMMDLKRI